MLGTVVPNSSARLVDAKVCLRLHALTCSVAGPGRSSPHMRAGTNDESERKTTWETNVGRRRRDTKAGDRRAGGAGVTSSCDGPAQLAPYCIVMEDLRLQYLYEPWFRGMEPLPRLMGISHPHRLHLVLKRGILWCRVLRGGLQPWTAGRPRACLAARRRYALRSAFSGREGPPLRERYGDVRRIYALQCVLY